MVARFHETFLTVKFAPHRLSASKYMKVGQCRNSTKFDVVTRFHEMIPTVKFVS